MPFLTNISSLSDTYYSAEHAQKVGGRKTGSDNPEIWLIECRRIEVLLYDIDKIGEFLKFSVNLMPAKC